MSFKFEATPAPAKTRNRTTTEDPKVVKARGEAADALIAAGVDAEGKGAGRVAFTSDASRTIPAKGKQSPCEKDVRAQMGKLVEAIAKRSNTLKGSTQYLPAEGIGYVEVEPVKAK